MPLRRLFALLLLAAAALVAPRSGGAQSVDVIRGRIIGPDSLPVEGAGITVTSLSGNVSRRARTDRNGRYTVTFPGAEGDYLVTVAAIGFAARRFEIKRVADEEILIADAKLSKVSTVLDPVRVTAQRDRVRREDEPPPDIGGSEKAIDNQAALPAASLGDLAAMAASLPGVQLQPGQDGSPDGFSVLGLGADQNNTTLNGMQFGGSNLPRDASIMSALATSPYDVSRGGFSGAQFTLRTRPGSNWITRGSSLNLDAPAMQWTDRASAALGQQYTNLSLGGLVSGPIVFDKAFYNISYQLGRRESDLRTLLGTDAIGLQAAGVSADSAARLLSILGHARVPATLGGIPGNRIGDTGSLFGSVDLASPTSSSGQALNVTFNGNWNTQRPASGLTTELPSSSGERTSWRGGVQGRHSSYFSLGDVGILSETSGGLSTSRSYSSPYLDMPAGRVRVNSAFADGSSGVQMLSFGGSANLDQHNTTRGAEVINALSWFSANNKHRLKLQSELRGERQTLFSGNNLLGTFYYNSLADLDAGLPAMYTRSLSPRNRTASQVTGALSLGDAWRKSSTLQVQYGVRVDGNAFLSDPTYNPIVEQTFGERNDRLPNRLAVSPRVGFSWTYGKAAQVAGFEGAMRGPRAVVRGGLGMFTNTPGTGTIASVLDNTGLAGALQQVTCIGTATPVPDWSDYTTDPSRIPTRCSDGSTGTVFSNSAPNVSLFARDWRAPRSLRSNLQWSGPILDNRFTATLDGTYSLNLNQSSFIDLNLDPRTRFTLADEGGRPVFVDATSIVPATGAIAARDALRSQAFSRVTEQRSDLRSESRQVSLRLAPSAFSAVFNWSASYVYSNVRERYRGFTSTTGNPFDVAWGRASGDSRHQIVYTLDYNIRDAVRVSWYGQFRSGTPFTPLIAGDVNGDGYSNDRAFVFDPSHTSDAVLADGMRALLEHGSRGTRECLQQQLGALASRNSCQAPWTSTANLSITFNGAKVRLPQRASLSLQVANPLGAADMLLHGSNDMRGWGQPAFPDYSLLYVRGFDPATNRYKYEVNNRFGATNPAFSAFRAPVTVTALMRFDLGPTRERQQLTQELDRGRTRPGQKMPEPLLRARYNSGGLPNPIVTILRQQDSLKLTGPQADSIATLNRWYSIRVDSIWAPVAKYLGTLPDRYDQGEAYDRYITARHATVDLLARLGPGIRGLLTPEQQRKLPAFVVSYLEPRYLASIRNGSVAYTGGMMIPGMGPMSPSGGMMVGGGGGGQQIIIRH